MTSTALTRKFRIGAALLDDPAPDLSPAEAVRLYEATYPHIAHCSVEEGGVEGDALIYNVVKPPAQTKGCDDLPVLGLHEDPPARTDGGGAAGSVRGEAPPALSNEGSDSAVGKRGEA